MIGVLSDTHDNEITMRLALDFFQARQVELVVHCGDWKSSALLAACAGYASSLHLPVRGVLGNNDTDVAGMLAAAASYPDCDVSEGVLTMTLAGRRLAAYHGHHKPTLRRLLAQPELDIVLLGHTHKPLITVEASRLTVNPGSTAFAIPRSKTWQPSVALVDVAARTADIHYLDRPV